MSDLTTTPSFFTVWTKHPLTILTAIAAIIYGLTFVFSDALGWDDGAPRWFVMIGAAIVGLLFISSLVAAAMKSRAV